MASEMPQRETSARLRAKLALLDRTLAPLYDELWASPGAARVYARFLALLHQIVRASVPLMEVARACAAERAAGDAVCAGLVPYYDEHIEEERHHDLWLLEDLEVAGTPRTDVLARVPSPRVAAMVGAQYYWARHHHPLALCGYIAVLEGSPPSRSFTAELAQRTGLPRAAFRTLDKHGEVDPGHGDGLDRLLDALPLTPAHEELLGVSLAHTTSALGGCIRELLAERAEPGASAP
jgi:hypothetical protein